MSDIPADIAEAACDVVRSFQTTKIFPAEVIARALLAERQRERTRCCSIATKPHPHDAGRPFWSQGKSIAQAIRNGAKPE